MKTYVTTGIILHAKNMFEKDKRIEIFTRDLGKVCLLAKYANTKSFKFGGKLDPLTVVECHVFPGKSFDLLTQCDLVQNFSTIRSHFHPLATAFYFLDIMRKTTVEHQPNPELYDVFYHHLGQLDQGKDPIETKHHFQQQFLISEGIMDPEKCNAPETYNAMIESYSHRPMNHFI